MILSTFMRLFTMSNQDYSNRMCVMPPKVRIVASLRMIKTDSDSMGYFVIVNSIKRLKGIVDC